MEKLFERIKIGCVELKNRIVMPAICTNLANEVGGVTERLIEYYKARAAGGVGLIIVESTSIDSPVGKLRPIQLCADSEKYIAGLNELAEAIKAHGSAVALQLNHVGRQTNLAITEGRQPVSSSRVKCLESWGEILPPEPRALTIKEIEELVEKFSEAARRAKTAGFDAVEYHGGHGYLIAQFLSPYVNRRKDSYGRGLKARMRFALEIIERTKEKVGSNFPIIFRLSADEYIDGGLTVEQSKVIGKELEEAGINSLHISAGIFESRPWIVQPMAMPRGCLVDLAAEFKKKMNIPIIAVGRINNPLLAERVLKEGKADLVAMGRALIADPDLPKKAKEGRLDDTRICIACNRCVEFGRRGFRMKCTVNPAVGEERNFKITPTDEPKKILVVGGGPAGMEAARVAALRGHKVILCEKQNRLGGQLNLSSVVPYKGEIQTLIEYLCRQVEKLGVEVKLRTKVTPDKIEEFSPHVIILATGAIPLVPSIPGVSGSNVVSAWDVLSGRAKLGEKIIVGGGGSVGCETAEFLAEKGKMVTIVEMLEDIGIDMEAHTKWLMRQRFVDHGIEILTNTKINEITNEGVTTIDKKSNTKIIEADNVIIAFGSTVNNALAEALEGSRHEFYLIGDCSSPRKILEAIHEGTKVGRAV